MTAAAVTRPVVVVGDVGLDVITMPTGPIHWHTDTPSTVRMVPGGAGANCASWLAAQGAPVTLVARVGTDAAGAGARFDLEAGGVRCAFALDRERPTGIVVIFVDEHRDRTMFPDRGANQAFAPEDVDLAGLGLSPPAGGGSARPHLHLSAYVLFDAGSRAGGLEALAQARALGWTTSVDPQAHSLLVREGVDVFLSWVDGVDLLLPNEHELATLGGFDAVLEHAGAVVATYGAKGARWVAPGVDEFAPVQQVHRVDATGCGDAFDAGLLAAWLAGADPGTALRAGVATGSAAAGRVGARPG